MRCDADDNDDGPVRMFGLRIIPTTSTVFRHLRVSLDLIARSSRLNGVMHKGLRNQNVQIKMDPNQVCHSHVCLTAHTTIPILNRKLPVEEDWNVIQ